MNILVSGISGFIGTNWKKYTESVKPEWKINSFNRKIIDNHLLITNEFNKIDVFIHLAGKAHDLRNLASEDEYYKANTDLTKLMVDAFLKSEAKVFIMFSSVKAAADKVDGVLSEDYPPDPRTPYGKSKLMAERYIQNLKLKGFKRIYILRPCMIHGPGNKGNLNLLYKIVSKGLPWPLGAFKNKRSFCSIDNLCFIINEIIENNQIPSGIYNIADDVSLSTNELINLISESQNKNSHIWNVPKSLINTFAKIGDILKLPLNSERLVKLTESYTVSNCKIKNAINKSLPLSSREGLTKTLNSFKIDA
jgi:nucleoside-diphosphate-sugar epimerase